jgi:hypothetical protein
MPRKEKKSKRPDETFLVDLFMKTIPVIVMMGYGDDIVQCRTLCKETFLTLSDDENYDYGTVTKVLAMSEVNEMVEKAGGCFYPLTAFFTLRRIYFNFLDGFSTVPLSLATLKIMIKHRMLIFYNILWRTNTHSPLQLQGYSDELEHVHTIMKYGVNVKIVIPSGSKITFPEIKEGEPFEYDHLDAFSYINEAINGGLFFMSGHPPLFDVIKNDDRDNCNLRAIFCLRDCLHPPFNCSWEDVKKQYVFGFDFFCSVLSVTTLMVCIKTVNVRLQGPENLVYDFDIKGVALDIFSFLAAHCSISFNGNVQGHDFVTLHERNYPARAERLLDGFDVLFDEIENLPLRYAEFHGSPFKGCSTRSKSIFHLPQHCSPLHWLVYGGHYEGVIYWFQRARFHKDDPALMNMPYAMAPWLQPVTPMQLARLLVAKITPGHLLLGTLQHNRLQIMWFLYKKGAVEMCELLTAKHPTGLFDKAILDEIALSTGLTRDDYRDQRDNSGFECMYETTALFDGETHFTEDGHAMAFYPFYAKRPEDSLLREYERAKAVSFSNEGWERHHLSD